MTNFTFITIMRSLFVFLLLESQALSFEITNNDARIIDGDKCPIELPEGFSNTENLAWSEYICLGLEADISEISGTHCDVHSLIGWPNTQKISNRFLTVIMQDPAFNVVIGPKTVRIRCARFSDPILLHNSQIDHQLSINNSVFDEHVDFYASKFNYDFVSMNSIFRKSLNLASANFEHMVQLENSQFHGLVKFTSSTIKDGLFANHTNFLNKDGDSIRFEDSKIGEVLELKNSQISGSINAVRLHVSGPFSLNNTRVEGKVTLSSSAISDNLDLEKSTFEGGFNANAIKIGNSMLASNTTFNGGEIRGSASESLNLLSAEIGGNLELIGASIENQFQANLLKAEAVYMRRKKIDKTNFGPAPKFGGPIKMHEAKIGNSLQIYGAVFHNTFDLHNAIIGGPFLFERYELTPVWKKQGQLNLNSVTANQFVTNLTSMKHENGDCIRVDLSEFKYEYLTAGNDETQNNLFNTSSEQLVAWLKCVSSRTFNDKVFYGQPYLQLAKIVKQGGKKEKSKELLFAMHIHESEIKNADSYTGYLWSTVLKLTIGFGLYPFNLLFYCFPLLVAFGWLAAAFSRANSLKINFEKISNFKKLWQSIYKVITQNSGKRLLLSLENSLPFVEFIGTVKNVDHKNSWLIFFLAVQKITGFAIWTILIGALTILSV